MYSLIYSKEQIFNCVTELANRLTPVLTEETIAIPVLNGGMFFAADLLRAIPYSVYISPVMVSSYKKNEVQGDPSILGLGDVTGKQVLLIDDICDSGKSFLALKKVLYSAKLIVTVSLIRRAGSTFTPDFVGFEYIGSEWLIGYGMDDNGKNRNLDGVYVRN